MPDAFASAPRSGQSVDDTPQGDRQDVDVGRAGRVQQQAVASADDPGRLCRYARPGLEQ